MGVAKAQPTLGLTDVEMAIADLMSDGIFSPFAACGHRDGRVSSAE